MRRRINRTLLTATAASASVITLGFMAAGTAGAATTASPVNTPFGGAPIVTDTTCTPTTAPGLPSDGCAKAGYQASGRLFRYAAASIVVPAHLGAATNIAATATSGVGSTPTLAHAADATMYVALDDSGDVYDYARVGIMPTCAAVDHADVCAGVASASTTAVSTWSVFASVVVSGATATTVPFALPPAVAGLGVSVSAYLLPSGNWVRFVMTTPSTTATVGGVTTTTAGKTYSRSLAVSGPAYTDAQAVADWTGTGTTLMTTPPQPLLAAAPTTAYDQFFKGRLTTWSGTKGTFNGKWTVNAFEGTLAGAAPAGANVVTSPSYLWSNDTGFSNDAFGVWIHSSAT
jgi:hypothetical protein